MAALTKGVLITWLPSIRELLSAIHNRSPNLLVTTTSLAEASGVELKSLCDVCRELQTHGHINLKPRAGADHKEGAARQQSNTPAVLRVNVALVSPIGPCGSLLFIRRLDVGLAAHVCHPPFTSSGFATTGGGGLPLSLRL
jgi:hypothetical protein